MNPAVAAARAFGLDAPTDGARPFGDGLIHETWRVVSSRGFHLLQRLNDRVFADPAAVAANAAAAAARVDDALRRRGDEDPRHRLVFLTDPAGRPWHRDEAGACWRAAVFIPDSRPPASDRPDEVRAAARALGRFPGLVAAGQGPDPIPLLPGFHDTRARLAAWQATVAADPAGRATACRPEIARLTELAPLADRLADRLADHDLPARPIHNDAKLDNVLVDDATGAALCVVDLDTVMPGPAAHDFGDLIRSAVTGRPEDEPDPARIVVDVERFEILAAGYLAGASDWIEPAERAGLVDGALVITYEQALRFLTDHLAGDTYYAVDDPDHNRRRARAQIRLLVEMLKAEENLRRLVESA